MLDAPNWTADVANTEYRGHFAVPGTAVGTTAIVPLAVIGPTVGPDDCNYEPPPFDVRSKRFDLPAAAFADFPLTVLP